MPYKTPEAKRERHKVYMRQWYLDNKKKHQKYVLNNKKKKVARIGAYKLDSGCSVCGYNGCAEALDFHHRDSSIKSFSIARNARNYGWDTIVKEIEKCDILCKNCHSELHAAERANGKPPAS